jgi:hypothetical protein
MYIIRNWISSSRKEGSGTGSESKLLCDWRFTANQFVLAPRPLRLTTRDFFSQLKPCRHSPYVTSSLTSGWVCLLWICLPFRQVYVSHVIEKFCFCTIYKSSVSTGFAKQIMLILRVLCYNGRLVTWTILSLITAKFKPLMFSLSGFALSYTTNMFILMIMYDFCLLSAQFCYIIIYIYIYVEGWKPCVTRGPVFTLENF